MWVQVAVGKLTCSGSQEHGQATLITEALWATVASFSGDSAASGPGLKHIIKWPQSACTTGLTKVPQAWMHLREASRDCQLVLYCLLEATSS